MSAILNSLLLEGIALQSLEKEKQHILVKIIQDWRESLVRDESGYPSVILWET